MVGRQRQTRSFLHWTLAAVCVLAGTGRGVAAEAGHGERVYQQVCIGCHQIGVLGAPKRGDAAAWTVRFEKGLAALVRNATSGIGKMPPKGGNPGLGEPDLRAAIQFMAGAKVVAAAGSVAAAAPGARVAAAAKPSANGSGTNLRGAEVVQRVCRGCHEVGVLGAPKIGHAQDWAARLKKGEDGLLQSAQQGIGNMPPKGGNPDLTTEDLRAAIRYMIKPPAPVPVPRRLAAAAPDKQAPATVKPAAMSQSSGANRFNRLLRPSAKRNLPPAKDGIHDPGNDGTLVLQPPRQAFESLPKSTAGNYVDWVQALQEMAITPRWDLADPTKEPLVMDLNIVREVKGSMPNVVYPHKQHLQWLDCSNCHPSIFEPRKGANQISMAEILLGRKCGVCHGKVAFPVSECRRCHSQRKASVTQQ